ncbi:hypothetical protein LCGC14_0911520 [marine sediment metagenome]|uniref:Uncharacterized protein n=1 Tax=marine sediment metagenome TaxID=412755 RepID=A0A0F9NTM3_9ZZZZ
MKDFRVAKWRLGNIFTPTHITYKNESLLCNKVYPHDFKVIIVNQSVVIDNVGCAFCIEKFGEIMLSRYGRSEIEKPITLRLGM